jgi:AAA15 family ATPase/GTPase
MAVITTVELEDFRCFRKLRVDGLARVNLIVGANNSGKTVLLEVIEAVVSSESPSCLFRASTVTASLAASRSRSARPETADRTLSISRHIVESPKSSGSPRQFSAGELLL